MKSFESKHYTKRHAAQIAISVLLTIIAIWVLQTLDTSVLQISLGYLLIGIEGFLYLEIIKWVGSVFKGDSLRLDTNNQLMKWIGFALFFGAYGAFFYLTDQSRQSTSLLVYYYPALILILIPSEILSRKYEKPQLLYQAEEWWLFAKKDEARRIDPPEKLSIEGYNIKITSTTGSTYHLLNLSMSKANKRKLKEFSEAHGIQLEEDDKA